MKAPDDAREWVSFEDPDEDRTWLVDVSFLASPWRCIYGAGCQGVLTGPAPELVLGCCSYGAHFTGEDDVRRVEEAAAQLTAGQWQHRAAGLRKGVIRRGKQEITTRLVDDACIFLNRPGFPAGPGCALHQVALERGVSPVTLKPDVCWQLPLRLEESTDSLGHVTSMLTQWDRRHWGPAGEEFHWWCTEAPEAFTGAEPVYVSMADELVGLVGKAVYARIAALLGAKGTIVPLPHPVLRTRAASARSAPR